ncbi:MAG TPA: sigma-70 family RNA polymerase sigma factor [Methylophilaceae bacterium]
MFNRNQTTKTNKTERFEVTVLIHLDAAYNLARWLMSNEADARDVVQIASLRALTYLDSLRGDDAKSWFLGIVRNCCMTALNERSARIADMDMDAVVEGSDELAMLGSSSAIPEQEMMRRDNRAHVNQALQQLPVGHREVLILREMEEMAYDEIAAVMDVPIGTVMSRLSRARLLFKQAFLGLNQGVAP